MNQQIQQGTLLSDRYTLLRELPSNHSGHNLQSDRTSTVWVARDAHSGDEVSIRILSVSSDWAQIAARKSGLAALVHPHILRTLDIAEQDSDHLPYIVSSFVDGLQTLPFDNTNPAATCRLIIPLLQALEYAHSMGVVHGAISADCLQQDAMGSPLLSGFGSELLSLDSLASKDHISPQVVAKQTPEVSDDVYSCGALLFFIFTGTHWIRETSSGSASSLIPESLQPLISSMLSDSPYERPQQISYVIARLEEYLDPIKNKQSKPIEATDFRKADSPAPIIMGTEPARPKSARQQRTVPAGTAIAFLAVLVLILLVVFLYQPASAPSGNQQATVPAAPPTDVTAVESQPDKIDEPAPYELAQLERLQDEAKILAAKLLRAQIELEDRGAILWASDQLGSVQALADEGDGLFRDGQFGASIERYQSGLRQLEELNATLPGVFAAHLAKGSEALEAGEAAIAIESFTIATRIDPDHKLAAEGLQRGNNLDALLQELALADELEQAGSLPDALSAFQRAVSLDPMSSRAKQGVTRISDTLRQHKFNQTMSRGFAALLQKDFLLARQSFEAAQGLMPDSPLPADGLSQVEIADRLQQIEALQTQAQAHEQEESWAAAAAGYEAVLTLDETLVFAQNGIQRANQRLELQQRLLTFINDPLLLRDDSSLKEARAALYQATLVSNPGPLLADQITSIASHIKQARIPVKVDIISDEQTDVFLYKVSQLGRIERVTLELFPGKYTVVGTRKGYRDTRQEFAVQPGQQTATISVVCSDRI